MSAAATSYIPLPYNYIDSLSLDCPSLDGKNYTSTISNQNWTLLCDFHYTGYDIISIFAYTWQDCIDACAALNHYASGAEGGGVPAGNVTCQHVLFEAHIEQDYNCWCKYKEAVVGTEDPARLFLSADLIL